MSNQVIKCRVAAAMVGAFVIAALMQVAPAKAVVIFEVDVDVDGGNGINTQSGFYSMQSSPFTDASFIDPLDDITVTVTSFGGQRDRGATNPSGPLSNLLRDLVHSQTQLNVDISDLAPNTEYLVTYWGFDTSNGGRGTRFYHGTDDTGTLIAEQVMPSGASVSADNSLATAFSEILTSDGSGLIPLFIQGDDTVPGATENVTIAVFNGLRIEFFAPEVIPEPSASVLTGLGIAALLLRRRRKLRRA